VRIPVVAIGGIDRANIDLLKGCGMAGFAIASGIFGAADVERAARELREAAAHVL
jgi:thiamine-phosphate pyrophosphorylase